jgi:mannose-6-phosphate isomerase-like protein (cupin superfamily)
LWKFINPDEFRDPGLRLLVHQVSQEHSGWEELIHRHPTDEVYIVLADEGNSLELGMTVDGQSALVRAPISVYCEAGVSHTYQVIRGGGLILKILRL